VNRLTPVPRLISHQQRFTISEVADDWREFLALQIFYIVFDLSRQCRNLITGTSTTVSKACLVRTVEPTEDDSFKCLLPHNERGGRPAAAGTGSKTLVFSAAMIYVSRSRGSVAPRLCWKTTRLINQARALGLNRDRNFQWMLLHRRSVPSVMHFKTTEISRRDCRG